MNSYNRNGRLIAIEGGDAVGKGTVLGKLVGYLEDREIPYAIASSWTSTQLGREIYPIITNSGLGLNPFLRASLALTVHRSIWEEISKPALAAGKLVLMDRSYLSTLVYQCKLEGCSMDDFNRLRDTILPVGMPDLTLLLCCNVSTSLERIAARSDKMDPMDTKDPNKIAAIRQHYIQAAREEVRNRVAILDTDCGREMVLNRALTLLHQAGILRNVEDDYLVERGAGIGGFAL